MHASFNVFNDVFDELNGSDRANNQRIYPFTGGSRFIQNGVLSLQQMRRWALLLLFFAVLLGSLLLIEKGPYILIFGLLGIALGLFYSAPPLQLASRGLGEFAVATGFGLLPVTGAAWVQYGSFDMQSLLLSIPVSCWVANILIINELPDVQADTAAGKRTLVVRLGTTTTRRLYLALSMLAFLSIAMAASLHWISYWSLLLPAALLLLGMHAATQISEDQEATGSVQLVIKKTLAIHAAGCIWVAGIIWA
jgi:1,4-dihydroxy-2-naphthoate octaprenyltransferase